MAIFTVEITDPAHLLGITAARQEYNNSLFPSYDENGQTIPNPGILNTDDEYVQFVMSRAAESYSKQYNT
jgi:hypothetical protein